MKKLSVVTVLYPFAVKGEKTQTLFEALIPSLQQCDDMEAIELSIVDCGTEDIYGRNRKYDYRVPMWRAASMLNNLVYTQRECIVDGAWHMSQALHYAVEQATSDYIFVVGIDIILPKNLLKLYANNVKMGKEVWVPRCYNILPGQPWRIPDKPERYNGWRTARGLMGMAKYDYYSCGGYPTHKVGFRVGIDAHLLRRAEQRYKVNEFRCEGLFHLHHMDSNATMRSRLERE